VRASQRQLPQIPSPCKILTAENTNKAILSAVSPPSAPAPSRPSFGRLRPLTILAAHGRSFVRVFVAARSYATVVFFLLSRILRYTARGPLVISVLITSDANDACTARQKLRIAIARRAYRGEKERERERERERKRERRSSSLPAEARFIPRETDGQFRARARAAVTKRMKKRHGSSSPTTRKRQNGFSSWDRGRGGGGGKKKGKKRTEPSSAREFIKIPLYNVAKIMRDLGGRPPHYLNTQIGLHQPPLTNATKFRGAMNINYGCEGPV